MAEQGAQLWEILAADMENRWVLTESVHRQVLLNSLLLGAKTLNKFSLYKSYYCPLYNTLNFSEFLCTFHLYRLS